MVECGCARVASLLNDSKDVVAAQSLVNELLRFTFSLVLMFLEILTGVEARWSTQ